MLPFSAQLFLVLCACILFEILICTASTNIPTSWNKDNSTVFLTELQKLYSEMSDIVNIINTTRASDDDVFTTKMLSLAGKTFQIQKNLQSLNFDELRLRTKLNMTEAEVDTANYLYFKTLKALSMFVM